MERLGSAGFQAETCVDTWYELGNRRGGIRLDRVLIGPRFEHRRQQLLIDSITVTASVTLKLLSSAALTATEEEKEVPAKVLVSKSGRTVANLGSGGTV